MKIRFLILILFCVLIARAHGQRGRESPSDARTALRTAVAAELGGPLFARCLAAVEIADARSGEILFSRNAELLLRPASNVKLFTSAAAVLGLPTDFHFETRLGAKDSTLRALVCVGGGDPLLTGQDIQKLVEMAYDAGVRTVDTLVMDGSLFADEMFGHGWMWDDEADPFMPYLGPFSLDGNAVTVTVQRGKDHAGAPVISTRPSSALFSFTQVERGRDGNDFRIERIPRSNAFLVSGQPRSASVRERFSIWRPQDLVAERLLRECAQRGIVAGDAVIVFADAPAELHVLGSIRRHIDEVLAVMNKRSDNLAAEMTLRALVSGSGRKTAGITGTDGIARRTATLAAHRLDSNAFALVDGSGISFYNLATAASLGRLLRTLAAHAQFARFRSSLAIAGTDGTLRTRMAGVPDARGVQAKTGTVRGVSALSGYVQAPGGRLLTVVMFMQNFTGRHSPYRDAQDRIMTHCLTYSAARRAVTPPR